MDFGVFLLIFSLLILVAVFVSRPFFLTQAKPDGSEQKDDRNRARSELLAEYERTINALQELDFDQALGKIPSGDYPEQRAFLLANGAELLKRLDGLQPEKKPSADLEARLEEAVAARRADQAVESRSRSTGFSPDAPTGSQDPLEEMIASRRQNRQEKSGGFCPRCGKPVLRSDRFCPRCGTTLAR